MPLTSSVKELGEILQKLINLDKIQNENETNDGSLAMRIDSFHSCELPGILRSVQRTRITNFRNEYVLTRTGKTEEKKAVLNSVWLTKGY
jgi:hypothetical protein